MADNTWYRGCVYHQTNHSVIGSGIFYLEGIRYNSLYEWQSVTTYGGSSTKRFTRSKFNGSWTSWIGNALESDYERIAASYLKIEQIATNFKTKMKITFSSNSGVIFLFGRTISNQPIGAIITYTSASNLTGNCSYEVLNGIATCTFTQYTYGYMLYDYSNVSSITYE